jgi:hypothetical protein
VFTPLIVTSIYIPFISPYVEAFWHISYVLTCTIPTRTTLISASGMYSRELYRATWTFYCFENFHSLTTPQPTFIGYQMHFCVYPNITDCGGLINNRSTLVIGIRRMTVGSDAGAASMNVLHVQAMISSSERWRWFGSFYEHHILMAMSISSSCYKCISTIIL